MVVFFKQKTAYEMRISDLSSDVCSSNLMSGHIFFAHDYYGFDDSQYAAVRLIRAVHMIGKSLTQIRGEMPNLINTPELRFQVDEPIGRATGRDRVCKYV